MSKPVAICISDLHFNLTNLVVASTSLKSAILKANHLGIPLIVAGDLNDTKAIIRAEVANALCEIFKLARTPCYIMVGNHDLCNEKSKEHGLNYLAPYANIVDSPALIAPSVCLIPYQNDSNQLKEFVGGLNPPVKILIMHQGFLGAAMGDYIQDKTSLNPEVVKDFTVISGHYHRHQTIGTVTYIGSPYTVTYGEANDGPKGFLILNEDGTFDREILPLRKHVIIEHSLPTTDPLKVDLTHPEDLVWIKVRGPKSLLDKLDQTEMRNSIKCASLKIDLIPNDSRVLPSTTISLPHSEIFDCVIEALSDTVEHKAFLKELYHEAIKT